MNWRRTQSQARRGLRRAVLTLEALEDRTLPSGIVVNGTGGNDTLVLRATTVDSGTYTLNGDAAVAFSAATSFTFNGNGGTDSVTLIEPTSGLFAPAGGILDNSSDPAGSQLLLEGPFIPGSHLPIEGVATYAVGTTPGAGTLTTGHGGDTQSLTFNGVGTVTDTRVLAALNVFGGASANTVTLDDGTSSNDGLLRVSVGNATQLEFADKTALYLYDGPGNAASNTVTLANTEAASGLQTVTLIGGDGGDQVFVESIASGTQVNLNLGRGDDRVNVTSGVGTLAQLQGALTIDEGGGHNGLFVGEVGSAVADQVVLTSDTITSSVLPYNITFQATAGDFGQGIMLATGAGADIVRVQSTSRLGPTSVLTSDGDDSVIVASAVGGLRNLRQSLLIDAGSGSNQLVVSDANEVVSESAELTFATIAFQKMFHVGGPMGTDVLIWFTIDYTATGGTFGHGVTLETGSGNDIVRVDSPPRDIPTTIRTNDGNDSVIITSALNLVDGRGSVSVDAGRGSNQLAVSDAGEDAWEAVAVTGTTVILNIALRPGEERRSLLDFPISYTATGGTFGQGVYVKTSDGNASVLVEGTAAGAPTFVATGTGNDALTVQSPAGPLSTLAGPLFLDAAAGSNSLFVSEAGSATADTVIVTSSAISSSVLGFTIAYQAAGGTFGGGVAVATGSAADTVNVNSALVGITTLIYTGDGADKINVAVNQLSSYTLVVNGGPPTGGTSGDVLDITAEGAVANVSNQMTSPGSGVVKVVMVVTIFGVGGNPSPSLILYQDVEQVITPPVS
jgi:hypothetical protein